VVAVWPFHLSDCGVIVIAIAWGAAVLRSGVLFLHWPRIRGQCKNKTPDLRTNIRS